VLDRHATHEPLVEGLGGALGHAIEEVNHILVLAKFARLKMCTHASISKEE